MKHFDYCLNKKMTTQYSIEGLDGAFRLTNLFPPSQDDSNNLDFAELNNPDDVLKISKEWVRRMIADFR